MTVAVAPLLPGADVEAALGRPGTSVVEVAWEDGPARIPGARRAAWQALLWDDRARRLATREQLDARLVALGVAPGDTLVLAGDPVQFATYALWVLALAGRPDVLLLDGGVEAWAADGRPTAGVEGTGAASAAETATAAGAPAGAGATPERRRAHVPDALIGREELRAALGRPGWTLLDARSPEEFSGERVSPYEFEVDHGAARAGRIPGARHLPHLALLDDAGRFRAPDELRAVLADHGVDPEAGPVVVYCRLGHRATLVWFALSQLLGLPDVRVYDGSWTEWGNVVDLPVER